jgi:hypothetical protein
VGEVQPFDPAFGAFWQLIEKVAFDSGYGPFGKLVAILLVLALIVAARRAGGRGAE